ncbi:MAG: hypothetical protein KAG37_11785 [Flavobacteriales bacterium]|nr:hypothetical protein [Flavobacteriales bacterium]
MEVYNNLLLIGGSGQNVGKTTLTIDILKQYSKNNKIIAIKTSCHFHGILDTDIVLANNDKYTIVKETVTNTGKDSSRMLEAGAAEVYFIQAKDEFIGEAYFFLTNKTEGDSLIICETASLRKHLIPEVFLALVKNKSEQFDENKQILNKADLVIEDYLNNKIEVGTIIEINNNKWKINKY